MPHVATSQIAELLAIRVVMDIEGTYNEKGITKRDRSRFYSKVRKTLLNELDENPEIRKLLKELVQD